MTNKNIFTGLAFLLLLFFAVTFCIRSTNGYYVNVFKSGGGWGYDIHYHKKTIIHQPFIPVLSGSHPFGEKDDAKKTGQLVVKKLIDRKSPRLSKEEVYSITGNQNE